MLSQPHASSLAADVGVAFDREPATLSHGWSGAGSLMATEPWKRPWEESHGIAAAAAAPPIGKPQSISPTVSRRLPPLDAGLTEQHQHQQPPPPPPPQHNHNHNHDHAGALQQQPPPPRRASLQFESSAQWQQQYELSAANKRRRLLLDADQPAGLPPSNAYSSLPHPDAQTSRRELPHPHSQGDAVPDSHETNPTAPDAQVREARDCCTPRCSGLRCRSNKSLVAELAAQFAILDLQLHGAIAHDSAHSPRPPPDLQKNDYRVALEWMLERVRCNNEGIRSLTSKDAAAPHDQKTEPPSASTEAEVDSTITDDMSREAHWSRQPSGRQVAAFPAHLPDGSSSSSYGPASPGNPGTSSVAAQSPHHRMLPSLQPPPSLPPPVQQSPLSAQQSPPHYSPTYQKSSSPAHMQHFQDLQHQVTVKTLALQTLQREYDALLAKLERQRTKSVTLEKKFQVTDSEINSLTDDRERLLLQVQTLETQTEELAKARDDARKEMAESGRQYIRIVEMANRLQAQGAEERRKWDDERKELAERIQMLEYEVTPQANGESLDEADKNEGPSEGGEAKAAHHAVRAEIGRLRARTAALEAVLADMRAENKVLQDSLASITAYAARTQAAVDKALDG